MRITHDEPYFDPYTHKYDYSKPTRYTVDVKTIEEYLIHRTTILNPVREITLIDPPKLPEHPDSTWFTPEPSELERLRADVDYIAAMQGVDLDV